jgi:hypothetical protein
LSMQKSSPIMPACKELRLAGGVVRIWVNSDVHKGFFASFEIRVGSGRRFGGLTPVILPSLCLIE